MQNLIGQSVGRYHIVEQLGEGGMAVVYKAFDTRLDCNVAIKFIRMERLSPEVAERSLKRFTREAKEMAGLLHPNIVHVTDFGEFDNIPFLVMPFVPGGTLKDQLGKAGKVMSFSAAARLLAPVARALEYAHQKGIIHRDIKPANILITESGQPLLTDFGVAKILDFEHTTQLTGMGMAIGTPEYMAPEQWLGKVTPQTDIYSLGIVFYEMVTGRLPYTADTPAAVMLKQATEPLPRPKEMISGLPEKVEQVIFKVLARDVENRYAEMGTFASVLEELIGQKSETESKVFYRNINNGVIQSEIESYTSEEIDSDGDFGKLETNKKEKEFPGKPSKEVKKRKVIGWLIGLGCLGVLAAIAFTLLKNIPPQTPALSNTVQPSSQPTKIPKLDIGSVMTREKDMMEMVYVPSGSFTMGSENGNADEKPEHSVILSAYWIDKTEVTNAMFSKCYKSGPCFPPRNNSSNSTNNYFDNSSYANYPVINVNWISAKTYCEWAGVRLPSEAEWEKAARGTDGRTYPWGNKTPDYTLANYNRNVGDTSMVGKFPSGVSPYGALDMAGNVWEWVADWYDVYPGGDKSISSDFTNEFRILRGGSWNYDATTIRSTNRLWYKPASSYNDFGFRCASDISP